MSKFDKLANECFDGKDYCELDIDQQIEIEDIYDEREE